MRNICRQIVGDNLKGEMALFSFPHPSGGEELRGAPLVYIPDLVQKVVDLLEENERLIRRSRHKPCKGLFHVRSPNDPLFITLHPLRIR